MLDIIEDDFCAQRQIKDKSTLRTVVLVDEISKARQPDETNDEGKVYRQIVSAFEPDHVGFNFNGLVSRRGAVISSLTGVVWDATSSGRPVERCPLYPFELMTQEFRNALARKLCWESFAVDAAVRAFWVTGGHPIQRS